MFERGGALALAALAIGVLFGCSEGVKKETAPVIGDTPATPATPWDTALQQYAEVIDALPRHPRGNEMLEVFKQLNALETTDPSADPLLLLAKRDPNGNVGLFALEKAMEAAGQNQEALLREMTASCPNSAVAALATDTMLGLCQKRSTEEFLNICDTVLKSAGDREKSVALFRRAQHFWKSGDARRAVADFLRLWAGDPEKVKQLGIKPTITNCLKANGYLLEAKLCGAARDNDGRMADLIRTALCEEDSPPSAVAYIQDAPNLQGLKRRLLAPDDPVDERLLNTTRAIALAIWLQDEATLWESMDSLPPLLALAKEEPLPLSEDRWLYLSVCMNTAIEYTVQFYDENRALGRERRIAFPDKTLRERFVNVILAEVYLWSINPQAEPARTTNAYARAAKSLALLQEINAYDAAIALIEKVTTILPNASQAPQFAENKADIFEKRLNNPGKAAAVYTELAAKYPDSRQGVLANLRIGMIYHRAGRFKHAYEALVAFLAREHPPSERLGAEYLLALCEAELGATEQAIARMQEVVQQAPDSQLGPQALLWLGKALQDYEKDTEAAQDVFRELLQRYPDSNEAQQATSYLP